MKTESVHKVKSNDDNSNNNNNNNNSNQDDEEPEIGQPYRNGGLVKTIKKTVQVTATKQTWTRKVVTMDTGIIFFLDHYIDEIISSPRSKEKILDIKGLSPSSPLASFDKKNTTTTIPFVIIEDEKNITPISTNRKKTLPTKGIQKQMELSSSSKPSTSTSTSISPLTPTPTPTPTPIPTLPLSAPIPIKVYSPQDPDLLTSVRSDIKKKKKNNSITGENHKSILKSTADDNDDDDDMNPQFGIWTLPNSSNLPRGEADNDVDNDDYPYKGSSDGSLSYEMDDVPFWKPQEIILYHETGASLDAILERARNNDVDESPGFWGYPNFQISTPRDGSDKLMDEEVVDVGNMRHAMIIPPSQIPPENFTPAGIYKYKETLEDLHTGSLQNEWPPQVDHIKKQLHGVGKLTIPKCFEDGNGKVSIKVFPKVKFDVSENSHSPEASIMTPARKGVTFAPPVGQWAYPKGEEEDDNHFLPVDVDLYWGNDTPAESVAGMSNDGSMDSWGLWGASNTGDDQDTNSLDTRDPEWQPEMSLLFPPGKEPDSDVSIQGRWAYRMTHNQTLEWPPRDAKFATVFASKDVPAIKRGQAQGIWAFPNDLDEANEEEWKALEVEILGDEETEYTEEGNSRPHGQWGILKGAEPDYNYDWQPRDVRFFPPNVTPSSDTWIQGRWAMKQTVGKLKNVWPPSCKARASSTRPLRNSVGNRWPSSALVYPAQTSPESSSGDQVSGTWKYVAGQEPEGASLWKVQPVNLLVDSDIIDDATPFGVWGVNEEFRNKETDKIPPTDIWFYAPDQEAERNCLVQGKWSLKTQKVGKLWPPDTISPLASPQRSVGKLKNVQPPDFGTPTRTSPKRAVGKLKIPGAFENAASPESGRRGKKADLPSLFKF